RTGRSGARRWRSGSSKSFRSSASARPPGRSAQMADQGIRDDTVAPFYAGSLVTIYHGRAEDVLSTLAKSSADLVATDPPYGVSYQSNWGRQFEEIANDD